MPNVFEFEKLLQAQQEQSEAVAKLFHAKQKLKKSFQSERVIEKTINDVFMTSGKDIPVLLTVSTVYDEFRQCTFEREHTNLNHPHNGFATQDLYYQHNRCNEQQSRCPKVPIMKIWASVRVKDEKDDEFLRIEKYYNPHSPKKLFSGPFYPNLTERRPTFHREQGRYYDAFPKQEEEKLLKNVLVLDEMERWDELNKLVDSSSVWAETFLKTEVFTEMFDKSVIEKFQKFNWRSNSFFVSIRDCLNLPKLKEYKEHYCVDEKLASDVQYEPQLTEHNEIMYVRKNYF